MVSQVFQAFTFFHRKGNLPRSGGRIRVHLAQSESSPNPITGILVNQFGPQKAGNHDDRVAVRVIVHCEFVINST